jgi:putative DNA primase/helicase
MLDLRLIAAALGGEVSGGQVLCPGPGHRPTDRSLAVRPARSMPGGIVVYSHCGDPWRECRDHVLALLGHAPYEPPHRAPRPPKSRSAQAWALQIWNDSIDPHGTLVERYLASRGLGLPEDARRFIRFHPHCPWTDEAANKVRVPALIALFRSIAEDEPSAIHRTALRSDATKIARKMLGPVAGSAIKVTADEDVLLRLGVAEGLESAMSAIAFGEGPVWALGSSGAIRNLPVLPGVETLALIAEHDRANEDAREVCGCRWIEAGAEVLVVEPSSHSDKDLNDILQRRAAR